jgi:anti-sigma B factor antagonist
MPLEFAQRPVDPDIVVFELKGRLTSGNRLSDAEYEAKKILAAGSKKLVLDITGVEYLDSAAVGMLVFISGEAGRSGASACVAGPNPRVSEILRICQVGAVITIQQSLDSALKSFGAA